MEKWFGLLWSRFIFFFKQKTAYEMRISDWSSDVCSSDLDMVGPGRGSLPARPHTPHRLGDRVRQIAQAPPRPCRGDQPDRRRPRRDGDARQLVAQDRKSVV